MKHLFVYALVVLILSAMSVPAVAVPSCEKVPDHPSCSGGEEPPAITPCPSGPISIGGSARTLFECDWEPTQAGSGSDGTIRIQENGQVSLLVVAVRDSSPGDFCSLSPSSDAWYSGPIDGSLTLTFDLIGSSGSYWEQKQNWCGDRADLNGDPLHLMVNLRAKKGGSVTVTLEPQQVER